MGDSKFGIPISKYDQKLWAEVSPTIRVVKLIRLIFATCDICGGVNTENNRFMAAKETCSQDSFVQAHNIIECEFRINSAPPTAAF